MARMRLVKRISMFIIVNMRQILFLHAWIVDCLLPPLQKKYYSLTKSAESGNTKKCGDGWDR